MKNKNLIVVLVLVLAVIGVVLIARPRLLKKPAAKKVPVTKLAKKPPTTPTKRAISKDKGALVIKILDSKKREASLRVRAFKSIDAKSSAYVSTFVTNRRQELSPGTYDIEIDTVPQRIYKNITVVRGREKSEDLGCTTGSINVKALSAKKTDAYYPMRILYSKSIEVVAAGTTNRALEIMPGVYDIEIGTMPRQVKKDVKVEAGKETALDLGSMTGTLGIRAVDESNKEVRYGTRITKSENGELVTTSSTNRPLELLKGIYNVEVLSSPRQEKKDVAVNAGEETNIEFLVSAPQPPPAKPKK